MSSGSIAVVILAAGKGTRRDGPKGQQQPGSALGNLISGDQWEGLGRGL